MDIARPVERSNTARSAIEEVVEVQRAMLEMHERSLRLLSNLLTSLEDVGDDTVSPTPPRASPTSPPAMAPISDASLEESVKSEASMVSTTSKTGLDAAAMLANGYVSHRSERVNDAQKALAASGGRSASREHAQPSVTPTSVTRCLKTPSVLCAPLGFRCSFPILYPDGWSIWAWRLLLKTAMCYIAVIIPLQVAFDNHFYLKRIKIWSICNVLVDVFFLLDIAVSFRTGFYRDGMLVLDAKLVVRNYLYGRFVPDLAMSMPYVWFLAGPLLDHDNDVTLVRTLRLLRLLQFVPKLLRNDAPKIRTSTKVLWQHLYRFSPSVTRVVQLIIFLLCACHWMGCLWWEVGTAECDINDSSSVACNDGWGPSSTLQSQDLHAKYAHAFFWGASLMTGFVPFDVVPHTVAQVLVTTLALFIGLLINIITISSTTSALQNVDSKLWHSHDRLERITRFLHLKRVPSKLSSQIIDFFNYRATSSHSELQENSDLEHLPHELHVRLALVLHQDLLQNCPFFHPLSSAVVVSMVQALRPVIFCPGQLIIEEGRRITSLYLIRKGVVRVWIKYHGYPRSMRQLLATLGTNDFFGERALMSEEDEEANATAESVSYCDMLTLSRTQCREVLKLAERHLIGQHDDQRISRGCTCAAGDSESRSSSSCFKQQQISSTASALLDEQRALESFRMFRKAQNARNGNRNVARGCSAQGVAQQHARLDMEQAIMQVAAAKGRLKSRGYARFYF
mmetsp:Transcript_65758/g.109250  ORF Transcript_65758/g.109250 Transcript_65758/m.109250 type:complete len:737 (-) Transcript_65758:298-2508(-)|eukprot:CAMPEP_0119305068 /NCGR_PEP_ID=MMETSP1333-20130426/6143_1 /TAXON_ID=418940 /ORGANISM="Scyphosphaera apsteinii, Strain RCC1455" /LENGTH=736 /DNA_ID=CAMNT_0007308071 /DNA_START=138 /DNA_END=2348 /DNA_ORIENTATION=+